MAVAGPGMVRVHVCVGILIETRVFGELIPLIVCSTALIVEEILMARMPRRARVPAWELVEAQGSMEVREAA
jgi:hypothetical protein